MPPKTVALDDEIRRAGYYPELVCDVLRVALGAENVRAHLVHPETTFDGNQVRRHMSVLVMTDSRLVVCHVDDYPDSPDGSVTSAAATTEAVPLNRVNTVSLTHSVREPERHRVGQLPDSLTLAIGWGGLSRIDLEPATCPDPACEADHGLTGSVSSDDIVLRVSSQAEGSEALKAALAFGKALSLVASGNP